MQLQFLASVELFFKQLKGLQFLTWAELMFFDIQFFPLCEIRPKAADAPIIGS